MVRRKLTCNKWAVCTGWIVVVSYGMHRLLLVLLFVFPYSAQAGDVSADTLTLRNYGFHASIFLTNSGFGAGIGGSYPLSKEAMLTLDTSFNTIKDEREQVYFTGPFGESVVLFKRNYFIVLPLRVGLEQRLWREYIEDSFRPFIHVAGGPVLGYQWPYFDDLNNNGIREQNEDVRGIFNLSDGEFRFGVDVFLGAGAYMGMESRTASLRAGYIIQLFTEPVDLMELRPEIDRPSRRVLTTPVFRLQLPL